LTRGHAIETVVPLYTARETARVLGGPLSLRSADHVCVLCRSRDEELAAIEPFLREGLDLGERCIYLAEDAAAGKRALGAIASHGALSILGRGEAYKDVGSPDVEHLLDWLRSRTDEAARAGFAGLRLVGEMAASLGMARLAEYEARLNHLVVHGRIAIMCTYDRTRVPALSIRETLATHPLVLVDGTLCRNPQYVSPDDYLAKDRPSGEVDRFIARLHAAQLVENERGEAEARRRTLARGMQATDETERRAIARELHDDIGQLLSTLQLAVGRGDDAARTSAALGAALESVRGLAHELRPPVLDELGLIAAIRSHAMRQALRGGLEVALDLDDLDVEREVATVCFRIVREAIANVMRHARAKRFAVTLQTVGGRLDLVVSDDGIGFDPSHGRTTFGLLGMIERAELVGGSLEITSSPNQGTTIRARIPF